MTTAPIPAATVYPCLRCGSLGWLDTPCPCPPARWRVAWRPVERRSFALGGLTFTLCYALGALAWRLLTS